MWTQGGFFNLLKSLTINSNNDGWLEIDCCDLNTMSLSTGMLKVRPRDMQLFKDGVSMVDEKQLQEYGITMTSAKAQSPVLLGIAYR